MQSYVPVIDYDEVTGMFGAYFPDALGCTAMGATEEEVKANAAEALAEWLADMEAAGLLPRQPD